MVNTAMYPFTNHDIRELPIKFLDDNQEQLSAALLQGLRSEADMRQLNGTLSARTCSILDAVLRSDSMLRLKRHGLRGFLPDAYGLTLKIGKDETAHGLANCSSDRRGAGPGAFGAGRVGTPHAGMKLESLAPCCDTLGTRRQPDERLTW